MARYRETEENRRTYGRRTAYEYLQGNAVRKAEAEPEYEPRPRHRRVSRQVHNNRVKEAALTRRYMIFMAAAAVMTVGICIFYLSLQASLTNQADRIATLQTQLTAATEANDARYNNINDSVSLSEIKDIAVNQLGMIYATPDQIITYTNPDNDYIKQYDEIPANGDSQK